MVPPLKKVISYKLLVISFIFLFLPYHLPLTIYHYSFAQALNYIRVAILQDVESLNLKVRGFYEITDSTEKKVLSRDKNLKTTITSYKDGISIGTDNFNNNKILISAKDQDAIIINGRRFRGNVQFIKNKNAKLLVVNHIDLEDYIKGILYHETSHYWPVEALKAQAIVCRSFALYEMQENKAKDYDVTSDIYSQVYGGRTSERYRTNKIIEQTKGFVLMYQNKLFPTYYHATCAGHTEDASMLWNIDIVPLKGVVCNFCGDSPHFKWQQVLSLDEIKDKLIKRGYAECSDTGSYSSASRSNTSKNRYIRDKIKNIKEIIVLDKDKSGRIIKLKIIMDNESVEISAKDFRNILGPNIIRSTNFNVNIINHDAVFEGLGWGHGVGMCQWGAYFMAKQGYTAQQILKYYYPNSELSTYKNY